jgi:hypothetical protein
LKDINTIKVIESVITRELVTPLIADLVGMWCKPGRMAVQEIFSIRDL